MAVAIIALAICGLVVAVLYGRHQSRVSTGPDNGPTAGRALYFAYGSNLSTSQMERRCPTAKALQRAQLRGYQLVFPRRSLRWKAGVAGIAPKTDATVEGVIYSMSEQDLLVLDRCEGVGNGRYRRERMQLCTPGGDLEAWVYLANPENDGPFPPTRKYVDTIIDGADEHGLPAEYIEQLRRITTIDD